MSANEPTYLSPKTALIASSIECFFGANPPGEGLGRSRTLVTRDRSSSLPSVTRHDLNPWGELAFEVFILVSLEDLRIPTTFGAEPADVTEGAWHGKS